MVEKNDKDQGVANLRGTEQTRQPALANDSTVGLARGLAAEFGMTWLNRSAFVVILLLGGTVQSWSAEPVTPIGWLLINPSSIHRKVVRLEGVVKDVAIYSGRELPTNRPICGADFKLEDDTGVIEVLYHVRCQAGQEQAPTVTEGMRIVVQGTMDALPTNIRTDDGKEAGYRVYADTIQPSKKP
jgi:hypothetical protein